MKIARIGEVVCQDNQVVGGAIVNNFNAALTVYQINVPYGLDVMPVITAEAVDSNAEVVIEGVTALPGMATITIKGNDGEIKSYFVNFLEDAPLSDNTYLRSLKIDGETIEGFNVDAVEYYVELLDDINIPVVSAQAYDENATIEITQAKDLPGVAIIRVVAEDGVAVALYLVEFNILTKSDILSRKTWNFTTFEVPENQYTVNLSGTLDFFEDGTSLWIDDNGTYEQTWVLNEENMNIVFDEGTDIESQMHVTDLTLETLVMETTVFAPEVNMDLTLIFTLEASDSKVAANRSANVNSVNDFKRFFK